MPLLTPSSVRASPGPAFATFPGGKFLICNPLTFVEGSQLKKKSYFELTVNNLHTERTESKKNYIYSK